MAGAAGSKQRQLKLGSPGRVCIVGAGPAGSFFAIHLMKKAIQAGKRLEVILVDRRAAGRGGHPQIRLKGCKGCAGLISPELYRRMTDAGIHLPADRIMETYTHLWFHGLWKNFPLKIPKNETMLSVFRGALPPGRTGAAGGFDGFLLETAVSIGARFMPGEAVSIQYDNDGRPCLMVRVHDGESTRVRADFAAVAAGVNGALFEDGPAGGFLSSLGTLLPGFSPPELRRTLVFEVKTGVQFLKRYLHRELYFIESGSKRLDLDHIALVPKQGVLTVALVGKSIDQADFPGDMTAIIKTFCSLGHIQSILPNLNPEAMPVVCSCTPFMAVAPARHPFGDRIAVVGDLMGARLYKDGIFSAFVGAQALAETVIDRGIDRQSLVQGCGWVRAWLEKDNAVGRRVLALTRRAFSSPVFSRVLYQTFATEMKFKTMDQWPFGRVLWHLGGETEGYAGIVRELVSPRVLASLLRGALKTLRNKATEAFFGLRWDYYGRYPAVVLKEQRDYVRRTIEEPLGIKLATPRDMERMYAVKVRAPAGIIVEELGRFGEASSRFLRLRFVDVSRVAGIPNQPGAVVRYRLKGLPVSMDIHLARCVPERSLFYRPAELFAENGQLIFDVRPTRDGNHRLAIYTAFDFRKGRSHPAQLFWRIFRLVFPDWAHDVVWNHAICCIKAEAERRAG